MIRTLVGLSVGALLLSAPAYGGSTGKVVVTVGPGSGVAQICAVRPAAAKKYGVNAKSIVGKCGTPNSRGVATLRAVRAGRWGLAAVGGTGGCAYADCQHYKLVRVRAGTTTRIKWKMPQFG